MFNLVRGKKKEEDDTPKNCEIEDSEVVCIHELGSGCFGTVWKGECRGKQVAVKVPHIQHLNADELHDLRREIQIMASNPHPNIMRFMGACTVPGKFKIVMEMISGDLEHLLLEGEGKNMSLFQRLCMAKEAAEGMNWLHCAEPAIIHRDLKLENLMFKKTGNTYSICVADFGLSCIKPKAIKTLKEEAKGTPLTRAPEIMEGKPFNQKADVYSFSMCLWEIVTCKDLFPHHSDYDEFMEAVCIKGERPPIPRDCLPSLKQLLEDCWQKDPSLRPDFAEINIRLNEILIEAAISEPDGRQFWRDNFLNRFLDHNVKWKDFVPAFYRFLGLGRVPRDNGNTEAPDNVLNLRALNALMARKENPESREAEIVDIEWFGSILQWFGPLKQRPETLSILDRMRIICSSAWFHGDIDLGEAQRRLRGMAAGTFLVRFSSAPGSFTITRLNKDKVAKNVRINQNSEWQFFVNSDSSYPNLEALIVDLKETLELASPCPGSRFEKLGLDEAPSGYEVYE